MKSYWRSMRALIIVLVVVASLVLGGATLGWAATRTVVSLEFDDGLDQQGVGAMLQAHGMVGSFYINSPYVGDSGYLSKTDLLALQANGNEIGGHTLGHESLVTLSYDQMVREIRDDRLALEAMGLHTSTFAYPFGAYNALAMTAVQESGYIAGRTVGGLGVSKFAETIPPKNPYALETYPSAKVTTTLDDLKKYVTDAEQNGGGWVPLVFHRVSATTSDAYNTPPAVLAAFLDWLETRSSQGTIVKTCAEVMLGDVPPAPEGVNLITNPSLELDANMDSTPDNWQLGGYGTNTFEWTRTNDAHTGSWAEQLTITSVTTGDRKLVTSQQVNSTPIVATTGRSYLMSAWYKSDQPVYMVAYYKNAAGAWVWWAQSTPMLASSTWVQRQWVTPAVPAGAVQLSVGLSMRVPGTMTMDDFALSINGVNQTITFPDISDKNYGDAPFNPGATASSGLPVTYSIRSGPAIINSDGNVEITGWGNVEVVASQAGDANFNPAPDVVKVCNTRVRQAQTITFAPIDDKLEGSAPFDVDVSASSGLPVSVSVVSGPATIVDKTVTLTGLGTVTLRATQDGDYNYEPATSVDRTFDVTVPGPTLGGIIIRKTDKSGALLGGAAFAVSPNPYGTGDLAVTDNDSSDASTAAGVIELKDVPYGGYGVTETKAPTGFMLDAPPQTATVAGTNAFVLTFADSPIVVKLPPTTTSLTPATALVGDPALTVTVRGANFTSSSVVQYDGVALQTGYVSSTQLTATIPAATLLNTGTYPVTVFEPGDGGGTSNAQTFNVSNPRPTLRSISPSWARVGSQAVTITLKGNRFTASSVVKFKGIPIPTTFISRTQLTAVIPATSLTVTGSYPVVVFNGLPGGGTSTSESFTVRKR